MGKLVDPILFSTHFDIDPVLLDSLGVFDPCLTVDTRLYIDPLLLEVSQYEEFSTDGNARFDDYFLDLLLLVQASEKQFDRPWNQALQRLTFPEIPDTCLGYGDGIEGSAIGPAMARRLMITAEDIVRLGVDRPGLFLLLPLLERNFGPDLISDMTTNIILPELYEFTKKISRKLEVPTCEYTLNGRTYNIPENDLARKPRPVLLVPNDLLAHLPIVTDWEDVASASSHNKDLRLRVSQKIGDIWDRKVRADKEKLRGAVLSDKESVDSLLDLIQASVRKSYDTVNDPRGRLLWQRIRRDLENRFPLALSMPKELTADSLLGVVQKIVEEFAQIIEKRGMWKALWHKTGHRGEKNVQNMFFIFAISWCKANNLDITPEADTGPGTVDFKFSKGYDAKVLVEVKLSDNKQLVAGYGRQLEIYKEAEETNRAIYLVVDVGKMGKKYENLLKLKNEMSGKGEPVSEIVYIDGTKKEPPSKQK